jgi:hypothetical protein
MSTPRACHILRMAMFAGVLAAATSGVSQNTPSNSSTDSSTSDAVRELREQVRELQSAVAEIRAESQRYREETKQLREELEVVRAGAKQESAPTGVVPQSAEVGGGESGYGAASPAGVITDRRAARAAVLDDQYDVLSGKVDEQYQTKIESASKYRMRLSGIVLLNLFNNIGTVDNIDYPSLVYERPPSNSGGSFGASLRQSQIGLEVFGPTVAGARTSADLQMDFGGGFARTLNGVNYGMFRLRTGTMRLDWNNTSVVAGQDALFFSPTSPTSFATLAEPALTYAGNLWGWIPQVRVEHRWSLGEGTNLLVQGGILDPLSGEAPISWYYRQPQAGEMSRQPAFATRIAWTHNVFGMPLRIGASGYSSRQSYGFGRNVDAWAGMTDWDIPFSHHLSLSGKFYRGRGIGGLGGGIGRSVLFSGDPGLSYTALRALNSVGGWAQLKYRLRNNLEFNGTFGQDIPYTADLRAFPNPQAYGDPTLTKNQEGFVNVIYRPRSDLLFSAEYRHLRTYTIDNGNYQAHHINLTMGVLF